MLRLRSVRVRTVARPGLRIGSERISVHGFPRSRSFLRNSRESCRPDRSKLTTRRDATYVNTRVSRPHIGLRGAFSIRAGHGFGQLPSNSLPTGKPLSVRAKSLQFRRYDYSLRPTNLVIVESKKARSAKRRACSGRRPTRTAC